MELLWLCPFIPYPLDFGGAIRNFQLMRAVSNEHKVHLACLYYGKIRPEIPDPLKNICTSVSIFRRDYTGKKLPQLLSLFTGSSSTKYMNRSRKLNNWLQEHIKEYDAVIIDHTQMAWAAVPKNIPRIIDLHNIESELLKRTTKNDPNIIRRTFRQIDAKKLEREEFTLLRDFQLILVTSDCEKELLSQKGLKMPIEVIANGVDTTKFVPAKAGNRHDHNIIFIGASHYYPNEEAILWFNDNVWQELQKERPALIWDIIGGNPSKKISSLRSQSIRVLGNVPEILPYFQQAKLLIVPLLSGGGTRLKILEAAAAGLPVVTTSIGCEGLPFKHKEHLLIADDPLSFKEACLEVLKDPTAAKQRATRARELVLKYYSWDTIGLKFIESIKKMTAQH